MKIDLLETLCCPQCRSVLALNGIVARKDRDIFRGSLKCQACESHFPIVSGFPALVPPDFKHQRDFGQLIETIGRKKFAQLLLADKLDDVEAPATQLPRHLVSPTDIRRGGQFSSARSGKKRLGQVGVGESERLLIEMLNLSRSHRFLDLCTGGGFLFTDLTKCLNSSQTLIGVDTDFLSLKMTQGGVVALGRADRCDFVVGDAKRLSFTERSFDTIVSNVGLDHIQGYTDAIREIARLLKPKGVFAYIGNTHRTLWGFEDLLSPEQQTCILNRQGIALGKDAIAQALLENDLRIDELIDKDARWGKWYVLKAIKKA